MAEQQDERSIPSFPFKPSRTTKRHRRQMRRHPLFREVLRAYSLCKRPVLGPIPPLEASEEVLFKEFAEEDHPLLKDQGPEGADTDNADDGEGGEAFSEPVPDEDMTAFLQHTLSTFTAHREEIEGLIKIRDGCCDKYMEFLRDTWSQHLQLRSSVQQNFAPVGVGASAVVGAAFSAGGGGPYALPFTGNGGTGVNINSSGAGKGGVGSSGGLKRQRGAASGSSPSAAGAAHSKSEPSAPQASETSSNEGDDAEEKGNGGGHTHKKRRENLPSASVLVLKEWMLANVKKPYPTERDKAILASRANISPQQVSNWFVNARKRIWQQMLEDEFGREQASTMMGGPAAKSPMGKAGKISKGRKEVQPKADPAGSAALSLLSSLMAQGGVAGLSGLEAQTLANISLLQQLQAPQSTTEGAPAASVGGTVGGT